MTGPGELGFIWPEQVVRGRRRLGEENVGTNHGALGLTFSFKVELKWSDKQNNFHNCSEGSLASSPVPGQSDVPPAEWLMSVLELGIFVDVELPTELAQSKLLLTVLALLRFLIWVGPRSRQASLQGGSRGGRTDTSC